MEWKHSILNALAPHQGCLETFLGGMETIVPSLDGGDLCPLETFLGGMETICKFSEFDKDGEP